MRVLNCSHLSKIPKLVRLKMKAVNYVVLSQHDNLVHYQSFRLCAPIMKGTMAAIQASFGTENDCDAEKDWTAGTKT